VAFSGGFALIDRKLQLTVDVTFSGPIIRTTSGADETENFLVIKQLAEVSSEEGVSIRVIGSGEKGG
jgi:hypothetical protein